MGLLKLNSCHFVCEILPKQYFYLFQFKIAEHVRKSTSVGTVLILKLVEALRRTRVDFDAARTAAKGYDQAAWEEKIRMAYGPAAQGVIDMEAKAKKNETNARLERIDSMEKNWAEITALLEALPASETVMDLLKSLDASYLPDQIEVDEEMLRNTFLYCKEVRARYTILQMIWDLGLLDTLSEQVMKELQNK